MIRSVLLIIAGVIVAFQSQGQISLTIDISDLRNNEGNILVDFRDGNDNSIELISQEIKNNKCVMTVDSLKIGKYSFKYFHDENTNYVLDTNWFGAPEEGYGFSNNAKGNFGPPPFQDTVFEIKNDTTVKCIPVYLKF